MPKARDMAGLRGGSGGGVRERRVMRRAFSSVAVSRGGRGGGEAFREGRPLGSAERGSGGGSGGGVALLMIGGSGGGARVGGPSSTREIVSTPRSLLSGAALHDTVTRRAAVARKLRMRAGMGSPVPPSGLDIDSTAVSCLFSSLIDRIKSESVENWSVVRPSPLGSGSKRLLSAKKCADDLCRLRRPRRRRAGGVAAHTESLSREGGLGVANGVFDSAITNRGARAWWAVPPRSATRGHVRLYVFFMPRNCRGGQK